MFILDIDECLSNDTVCFPASLNTSCTNTIPGYTCGCPAGYEIKDDITLCEGNIYIYQVETL